MGEYSSIFTFGAPHVLGSYKNGQKNGRWTEIAESGDTIVIETYLNGKKKACTFHTVVRQGCVPKNII